MELACALSLRKIEGRIFSIALFWKHNIYILMSFTHISDLGVTLAAEILGLGIFDVGVLEQH